MLGKRPSDERRKLMPTTLGFLKFVLWTTFALSLVWIPMGAWIAEADRAAAYSQESVEAFRNLRDGTRDTAISDQAREKKYVSNLAAAVNPHPTLVLAVMSAGFLALIRAVENTAGSIHLSGAAVPPAAKLPPVPKPVLTDAPKPPQGASIDQDVANARFLEEREAEKPRRRPAARREV
jgi:hypothetical protein